MNPLLDIHTHHAPTVPGQAIENVRFPAAFNPEPGRYYSIGIHPWDVNQFDVPQVDWNLFLECASHPQVIAIGECGMDKCVHTDLLLRQECMFSRQIKVAQTVQKPILLHNVRSSGVLRLCREYSDSHLPWIEHGFRGNAAAARRAVDYHFDLSFGPRYNEEAIRAVPLDRLLLETDDSGKSIFDVFHQVASTLGISVEKLNAAVQENIQRVFFSHKEL